MSKTNLGLVEYAKAQLGKPYWYGTFGQVASRALYEEKKRQHPSHYQWKYAGEQEKVHDCGGLVKGYLWCDTPYNGEQDISANQMRGACTKSGGMEALPEVPGILVFKPGHVGIYIGSGEVIEARGRSYGVVKTKVAERGWASWGYCHWLSYEETEREEAVRISLPVLKRGVKSQTVRAMQMLLLGNGCTMESYGADGSFGGVTQRALKAYQEKNALEADGICGLETWNRLLGV